MPVRPYRPPTTRFRPWAYHAGAVAADTVKKGGRQVARNMNQAAGDRMTQAINIAVEAGLHLLTVLFALSLVVLIFILHFFVQVRDAQSNLFQFTMRSLGVPNWIFRGDQPEDRPVPTGGSLDMSDRGKPVQLGQTFNRFDGRTVRVNSGWGPRNTGIPGASRYHRGIDLPLEIGYPIFAWTETQVNCAGAATDTRGYGLRAKFVLADGPEYLAAHLSQCQSGKFQQGQIVGRIGSSGTSSGPHLHWEQWQGHRGRVHPQTNPLQAVLTGTWPGAPLGGGDGGGSATEQAVQIIKRFEGFHPRPYWDHQQWSWGFGTRAPGPQGTISREQAERDLRAFLDRNCWPKIPGNLATHQRAALASLCYNIGPAQFATSTALTAARAGNLTAAANGFSNWTRASGRVLPGLVSRRRDERALFEGRGT